MTNQTPSASGPSGLSPRADLLQEAARLIEGDRDADYGSPAENFANIAELWNTRFGHMLKRGATFHASDVADAMILTKVARNVTKKKRDGYADIAGYAACGYETWRAEQASGGEIHVTVTPPAEPEDVRRALQRELDRIRRAP